LVLNQILTIIEYLWCIMHICISYE